LAAENLTGAENPIHFGGDLNLRRFGLDRAAMWTPLNTLIRARVPLAITSDSGPGNFHSNAFVNVLLATTYPSKPKEAITREQAVIAYTRTLAYSVFGKDRLGTLEPGKLADLAVLSQDVFKVPDTSLPKTESILTIVGGKIARAQNGFE
jgi:predicted amidohydrolase YtcJ